MSKRNIKKDEAEESRYPYTYILNKALYYSLIIFGIAEAVLLVSAISGEANLTALWLIGITGLVLIAGERITTRQLIKQGIY